MSAGGTSTIFRSLYCKSTCGGTTVHSGFLWAGQSFVQHVYLSGGMSGDDGTIFNSSEQEFQFKKVVDHGKAEEAYDLVEIDDTFYIKAHAHELILTTDISEEWLNKEEEVLC